MRKIKRMKFFALILLLLLLVPVAVVLGQGDVPVEGGVSQDLDAQAAEALSVILGQVSDLTLLPFAVPLVVILVALVKRIPGPMKKIPAGAIHLVFQVVIWVAYAFFVKVGRADAFQEWTEGLVVILQTLLPLVASLFGANWLYDKAKGNAIPLLGFERDGPGN